MDDPLRICPRNLCLLTADERFCPWCGEALEPLVGRRLQEYEVRGVLGQGQFGVVYRAHNPDGRIDAAVKVLSPPDCYRRDRVEALLGEVQLMAADLQAQDCPEIVEVTNVRREPFPHIIMAFANAGSLKGLLTARSQASAAGPAGEGKRSSAGRLAGWVLAPFRALARLFGGRRPATAAPGDLPPAAARKLVLDIALALEHAHAHGVVHRDLKPGNVLLHRVERKGREELSCKVVDWGTSSSTITLDPKGVDTGDGTGDETTTVAPQGDDGAGDADADALRERLAERYRPFTPKYGPPEHFEVERRIQEGQLSGEEIREELQDTRSDAYQFGLIAYEILTGEFPFEPMRRRHLQEGYTPATYWEERYGAYDITRLRDRIREPEVRRRVGIHPGPAWLAPLWRLWSRTAVFVDVVDRCLSRERERRPADGAALVRALRRRPALQHPVTYTGAGMLMVAFIVWMVVKGGDSGTIASFWEDFPEQVPAGVVLEDREVATNGEEGVEAPILWTASFADPSLGDAEYTPTTASVPAVAGAALEAWALESPDADRRRIVSGAESDPWRVLEDAEVRERDLVRIDGGQPVLRVGAIFEQIAAWKSGTPLAHPDRDVFRIFLALRCETRDEGNGRTLRQFFEVVEDRREPVLDLEGLALVSPEGDAVAYPDDRLPEVARCDRDASPAGAGGDRPKPGPRRLWFPAPQEEGAADLRLELALEGLPAFDRALVSNRARIPTGRADAGLFVRIDGSQERSLPRDDLGVALGRYLELEPRPRGRPVRLELIARTKAQAAAGKETRRCVELVLDSGPGVDVPSGERWEKRRAEDRKEAVLELVLDAEDEGLSPQNCELAWRFEEEADTVRREAGWLDAGGGAAGGSTTRVRLDVRDQEAFLEGNTPRRVVLLARETGTRSAYPDGLEAEGWREVRGVPELAPDPALKPGDIEVTARLRSEGDKPLLPLPGSDADGPLVWRALDEAHWPVSLRARPDARLSESLGDDGISFRWRANSSDETAETEARTVELADLFPAFDLSGSNGTTGHRTLVARLEIETVWGRQAVREARLRWKPDGATTAPDADGGDGEPLAFPAELELVAGDTRRPVLRDGAETFTVRRADTFTLEGEVADPFFTRAVARLEGRDLADERTFTVEVPAGRSEGEHRLELRLVDAFGNERRYLRWLHVLGEAPRLRSDALYGGTGDGKPVPLDPMTSECSLELPVVDASGIHSIRVERDPVSGCPPQQTGPWEFTLGGKEDPGGGATDGDAERPEVEVLPVSETSLKSPDRGLPAQVRVIVRGIDACGERIEVLASDEMGREVERVAVLEEVRCQRRDGDAHWLGLDWIWVQEGEAGFYITATEVPRWFLDHYSGEDGVELGPDGRPPSGAGDALWLPAVGRSAEDLRDSLLPALRDGIGPVYLPTRGEWERLLGAWYLLRREPQDIGWSDQDLEALADSCNVREGFGDGDITPVYDFEWSAALEERVPEALRNIRHVFGNVAEWVEFAGEGAYRRVGGSVSDTPVRCLCTQRKSRDVRSYEDVGFRLVLYTTERAGSEREINRVFARDRDDGLLGRPGE